MVGVHVAAQLIKNSKCYLDIANLELGEGAVPSGSTEHHLGDSRAVGVGVMKLRRERRRECCRPAQLPTDAV